MQATSAPLSAKALPASAELCSSGRADGLDAAGGEEIPDPGRACRVHGQIAERGQEHLGTLAGPGEMGVGGIAQPLERLGEPSRMQRGDLGAALGDGLGQRVRLDLDAVVGEHREGGDAGELETGRGDVAAARLCNPGDLGLDEAALQRTAHAAFGLDVLELGPRRLGEVVGQLLDVPGAVAGIGDAPERALLLQHQVGVAGDAARKRVGLAHGPGEGQHGDGVGAAERRAGAGNGGAQHVHPRIAPRHHALQTWWRRCAACRPRAWPRRPRRRGPRACGRPAAWPWSGTGRRRRRSPGRSWRRRRAA